MSVYLLVITAFSLSMDAFAVSITNGICYNDTSVSKNSLYSGLCFGFFQGLMPLLGFLTGSLFKELVESIDHWIALLLLGFIGAKMILDAIKERKNPEACEITEFSTKTLLLQGVATSIDAFAVGIGFAVMNINIFIASSLIALTTFVCSFFGVLIGKRFGAFLKDKAQFVGGVVLILIGINIFFDHMIG